MNTKDTNINDMQFQKLLHDANYYKQIFKKTEKIVSVVFYILNKIDIEKKSETHVSNIASKAHFVHENALRSLEVKPTSSKEVLEQFAQALIGLDSTLRIAAMSSVISGEVLTVLINEIDTVLRGLQTYISNEKQGDFNALSQFGSAPTSTQRSSDRSTFQSTSDTHPVKKQTVSAQPVTDRRDRIKTILEAKGEATIKDISEIITDCSEKTVQRELGAMIEDNIVKRQGERRWSKYSLF